jgi:hypothetical protein
MHIGTQRRVLAFLLAITMIESIKGCDHALAMGSTKFGTYSQEYLDRQKCKEDARAAGKSDGSCKKHRDQ